MNEKLGHLNEHLLIMKQSNDLQGENLLLTQTISNQFWSEHTELSIFLDNISKELLEIHLSSTSSEHIDYEQEKFNQLLTKFANKKIQYQEFLQQHCLHLLSLISNNQQETTDIQCSIKELEEKWNRIEKDLNIFQQQLSQAMIRSSEFNAKLESVSTWFDETSSLPTTIQDNNTNDLEHIRTVKEDLDKKYIDIVNLKQDYTNIDQQNEHIIEEQFEEIDSKWTQLNDKIQEQ